MLKSSPRWASILAGWGSIGISSPCASRLSRYPRIASFTISRASSSVSPSVTSPARAGTVTVKPPSGAGSKTAVYWNCGTPSPHRVCAINKSLRSLILSYPRQASNIVEREDRAADFAVGQSRRRLRREAGRVDVDKGPRRAGEARAMLHLGLADQHFARRRLDPQTPEVIRLEHQHRARGQNHLDAAAIDHRRRSAMNRAGIELGAGGEDAIVEGAHAPGDLHRRAVKLINLAADRERYILADASRGRRPHRRRIGEIADHGAA